MNDTNVLEVMFYWLGPIVLAGVLIVMISELSRLTAMVGALAKTIDHLTSVVSACSIYRSSEQFVKDLESREAKVKRMVNGHGR